MSDKSLVIRPGTFFVKTRSLQRVGAVLICAHKVCRASISFNKKNGSVVFYVFGKKNVIKDAVVKHFTKSDLAV